MRKGKIAQSVGAIVLAILAAPSILLLFPALAGGSQADVVLTGSMEPAIHAGDLVVLDVPADRGRGLAVGDVIAYRVPASATIVLHRIIEVQRDAGGWSYVTQGDANPAPDPNPVPSSQVVGTYSLRVPYYGLLLNAVGGRLGLVILVIVPSLFVLAHELKILARGAVRSAAPPKKAEAKP